AAPPATAEAAPSRSGQTSGVPSAGSGAPTVVPGRTAGTAAGPGPGGPVAGDTQLIPADDGSGTTVLPAVDPPAPSTDVEATQVQPAVRDEEPPAPPTRRSVRSTPLHPHDPR